MLAFWGENVRQSYKAATDYSNLAAFVGPIVAAILGVIGTSAFTQNKAVTTLGAGIGVLAWFFIVLLLFVTPARLVALHRPSEGPDVTLQGTFPGTFMLHARGHASEIRTGPIVLETVITETVLPGEQQSIRVSSPRYKIEFQPVSDLHENAPQRVEPSLAVGPGQTGSHWPIPGATQR